MRFEGKCPFYRACRRSPLFELVKRDPRSLGEGELREG